MFSQLNPQFVYQSQNVKNTQNSRRPPVQLADETSNLCPTSSPVQSGAGNFNSEIDQYINALFQNANTTQTTAPVVNGLPFKQEDSRLAHTDAEDSGFLTSSSPSPQLSPQLSPMSTGSYTRMDSMSGTANSGHPFGDDYNQLSFHGVAGNWTLDSMPSPIVPVVSKEIKLFATYPSKSAVHNCELRLLKQPEAHHRARYMTEGSRGTIKDRTGRSYPVVQLYGYNKCQSVKVQCFIGHDQRPGEPHLFYQACEVSGKTAYRFTKVDGINVIELELSHKGGYQSVVDCMGILKERNVDVERKVLRSRRRTTNRCAQTATEEAKVIRNTNKSRSTHCRMVFRCLLPDTGEVLQVVSEPILCTQPLGSPEIYKMSVRECDVKGGHELFIIGKNFHKDTKVVFQGLGANQWRKTVQPLKEFLNSTHLVCLVPAYDGPDAKCQPLINVDISVHCDHKASEPMKFMYTNHQSVVSELQCSGMSNGGALVTGGRLRGKVFP